MKVSFAKAEKADPKWEKVRGGCEDLSQHVYDGSCVNCFLACRRRFKYKYIDKLLPLQEKAAPTFGIVFHEMLRVWYESGDLDGALAEAQALPEQCGDPNLTRGRAESIMQEYVKRYPEETWELAAGPEYRFDLDMPNGVTYSGRMDLVVRQDSTLYPVDHKTDSTGSYASPRPFLQFDGYCYAIRRIFGECGGAIKNRISTAAKPRERFHRDVSPRTKQELDSFEEDWCDWIEDIETAIDQDRFPRDRTYCGMYRGCTYSPLCIYGDSPEMRAVEFRKEGEE